MRVLRGAAGFEIQTQRGVFRIPAGLLLPPVPAIAAPPGAPRAW